jgi:hypothetical protein
LNTDLVRSQIRGTLAEGALVALGAAGGTLSHDDLASAIGSDTYGTHEVYLELERFGLVDGADYDRIPLNSDGQRLADMIVRSRTNGPDRWDTVQRGLLAWIGAAMRNATSDYISTETATAFGVPFTAVEIAQATEFLDSKGLIVILTILQTQSRNPTITSEGRYALHHHGTIAEFVKSGGSSTTYDQSSNVSVTGGSNVAVQSGGQGNVQTVTQTLSVDSRIQILAKVSELLTALPANADASVRTAIEKIRDEAASDKSTIATMKDKALAAMVVAVGTGVGHQIVEGLAHLAQMISA